VAPSDTAVAPAAARGIVPRRELFERLSGAARVTEVSAPAGSGKTFLLRSWLGATGLADTTAWVAIPRGGVDPQGLWLSVLDALRDTVIGAPLVRELTGAPDLDGWPIVERLLDDLRSLDQPVWLVIDDLHELRSEDALRQLELLLMRAPDELRFLLATRHDLRLGLHRLRLEGGLTEIRASDLRFTTEEARALFETAGVELSDPTLELLEARTEGWAAGLRLAALSLAGHSDPERFAAEFSGSERTVAEYLLAEVLERPQDEVQRLPLRTSILDQVNGELAERLTGSPGADRLLRAGGVQCVRVLDRPEPVVVSLPPHVRRPARAGTAAHGGRRDSLATSGRRRMARHARAPRRGGTPRPSGPGLEARRTDPLRLLVSPRAQRSGGDRA
jgi:LuxR family transcriptional regulator, maltose regulon positive regulatory protein